MKLSRRFSLQQRQRGAELEWCMRWREDGRERSHALRTPAGDPPSGIREARQLALDHWESIVATAQHGAARGLGLTLQAALDGFIARPEIAAPTRSFYTAKGANLLAGLGNVLVAEIGQASIDSYIRQREKARASLRHEIAMLRAVLRWAAERGHRVQSFRARLPPVTVKAGRALTPQQVATLAARPRNAVFGHCIMVLAYTGLRIGELLSMRREQLDLEAGTMRLVSTRRGRTSELQESILPISEPARAAFAALAGGLPPGEHVVPFRDRRLLNRAIARAAKGAGLGRVTPHTLRHTFCTWVGTSSRDVKTAQVLMRHRSPVMTMHYWHPPTESIEAVLGSLAGQIAGQPPSPSALIQRPRRDLNAGPQD